VALDGEHKEGIELVEGVEYAEEVAGVSLGCDGEQVAERGREEGCELGFGEEFEEGGLRVVEG
jgi:hypothetical protein